jgi:hypothetical protein
MNLEFFIRMRDMVSSGLMKMAATARKTTDTIKNGNSVIARTYDEIRRKVADFENSLNSSRFGQYVRRARQGLDEIRRAQMRPAKDSGGRSSGGGGGLLGNIVGGNLLTGGIVSAWQAAKGAIGSVIEGAFKEEQYVAGLQTFLGLDGAKEAIKNIKKDAASTPFATEALLDVNMALISTGLNATAARKDTMNLANAVAGAGKGNEELSRMAANMQQIKNVGKATATDIKQFGMAGINIYGLLARSIYKTNAPTEAQLRQVADLDVSYEMLSKALEDAAAAGGIYDGAMERMGKTSGNMWESFKDNMSISMGEIGTALKPFIDNILGLFLKAGSRMPDFIKKIQPIIDVLNSLPIEEIFGEIVKYMSAVFADAQKIFIAIRPAIEELLPLIGTIIEVVWPLIQKIREFTVHLFEKLGPTLKNIASIVANVLGPAFRIVGAVVSWLIDLIIKVVDWIAPILETVTKFISWIVKEVAEFLGLANKPVNLKLDMKKSSDASAAAIPGGNSLSETAAPTKPSGEDETVKGITGSGPRVININGVKFADKIEVHNATAEANVSELERLFEEMYLRVLNSGAAMQ